jgi:hypothetical protein
MRMIIAVFAALSVGVLSQAFGTDPPTAEAAKPTAPAPATPAPASPSADSSATITPTAAELPADGKTTPTATNADGTKPVRLIVGDSAAEARLKKLRAAGYRPEAHGDEVVFCRREPVLGTHFQHKVCNTAEQLESMASTSQDEVEQMQRDGMKGNPSSH